ncbi:hypothetical protein DB346_05405 [Verrucomicrobia bacterium LW23]|nr:hypothetical protein DB346_05405 [Verrucomicrobia bacterium LW23]
MEGGINRAVALRRPAAASADASADAPQLVGLAPDAGSCGAGAQPQRAVRGKPVGARAHQARHPAQRARGAIGRAPVGCQRYRVRIISHRRRLLDQDNACAKYHIDSLRYAGLLPNDAPALCRIEPVEQIQVATEAEEKTVVVLDELQ